MQFQKLLIPLASLLLAAAVVTLLLTIPALLLPEEPWNIVVVSEIARLARTIFLVVAALAFVLGLPLFLFLRSRGRIGIASCALGGFLIGAVPFGALTFVSMMGVQHASSGGKPIVINGVPTLAGWIEFASNAGSVGLFGLGGGLTFWIAMRLSGEIAGRPQEIRSDRRSTASWSITSFAVILTCTLLVLPVMVRDGSCHNLFRDGRTSIGPQVYAEMKLSAEDWPALRQIFVDFGAAHSLFLRSDENIRDGNLNWRDLNLCNEDGINIDALDRPWLNRTRFPLDLGMTLRVYALTPGADWKLLARDLVSKIDMTWPGKTTFKGPDGQVIPVEEALKGRQ